MSRAIQKPLSQPTLSRSERKAADIDNWVKKHIAQSRDAQNAKTSRLKALREARDAEFPAKPNPGQTTLTRPGPARIRRMWVSGSNVPNDSKRRGV